MIFDKSEERKSAKLQVTFQKQQTSWKYGFKYKQDWALYSIQQYSHIFWNPFMEHNSSQS